MRVDAWNDARPTLLQKLSKEATRRKRWNFPLSRWARGKEWFGVRAQKLRDQLSGRRNTGVGGSGGPTMLQ